MDPGSVNALSGVSLEDLVRQANEKIKQNQNGTKI